MSTTIPTWRPQTQYATGSVVTPLTSAPTQLAALANPDFESGGTGWTIDSGGSVSTDDKFTGTHSVKFTGTGTKRVTSDPAACPTGVEVSASAYYAQGGASKGHNIGKIFLEWRNSSNVLISRSYGNAIDSSKGGWKQTTVKATAPANTAKVCVGVEVNKDDGSWPVYIDAFSWSTTGAYPQTAGITYKAVQTMIGVSAATEPAWPNTTGVQVVDGTVTWEGQAASYVEWKAVPLYKSGGTEPTWPTGIGESVVDGGMVWECIDRRVTDEKCPNTKVVAIISSKVFASDENVARFSSTTNPLDWHAEQDAGYLPTGLQQANADDLSVMMPYRGNLCVWNNSCFQMWQTDPDPAMMALLDQMDGIGSKWQLAAQAVGNDLFFLSQLGVRSVNVSNQSENLQAGDIGTPIDLLVQAAIAEVETAGGEFISTYYPSAGQYWLARNKSGGTSEVFVLTIGAGKGKWSRYLYSFPIDAFTQLSGNLYIRSGDFVVVVDEDRIKDAKYSGGAWTDVVYTGVVQWPWLDAGVPNSTKQMKGFDVIGEGVPKVSFGYDQRNGGVFTAQYEIVADTVPGMMIPMPLMAPSFSVKLDFDGTTAWRMIGVTLYLNDTEGQP